MPRPKSHGRIRTATRVTTVGSSRNESRLWKMPKWIPIAPTVRQQPAPSQCYFSTLLAISVTEFMASTWITLRPPTVRVECGWPGRRLTGGQQIIELIRQLISIMPDRYSVLFHFIRILFRKSTYANAVFFTGLHTNSRSFSRGCVLVAADDPCMLWATSFLVVYLMKNLLSLCATPQYAFVYIFVKFMAARVGKNCMKFN